MVPGAVISILKHMTTKSYLISQLIALPIKKVRKWRFDFQNLRWCLQMYYFVNPSSKAEIFSLHLGNKELHQILTFEQLIPGHAWHCTLTGDENDCDYHSKTKKKIVVDACCRISSLRVRSSLTKIELSESLNAHVPYKTSLNIHRCSPLY